MELAVVSDGAILCANMSGKFTFSDAAKFKTLLEQINKEIPNKIEANLAQLSFVDSAALGMLLLLKDAATKINAHVVLKGAQGQVDKLLRMSRFDQIFSLAA